ncbi:MAG: hypothetical protein PHP25_01210 [Candidatus Moranbacteria bacterium]|nr:hypothetical protein [Candidatus Moranbacteria bacterium]
MKNKEQFFLTIIDEDKKIFTVKGPMTDDTLETNKTAEEQEKGRNVRCYSTGDKQGSIDMHEKDGFVYRPDDDIL